MNTDQVTQPLEDAPKKLTLKGIPVDPNLRILGVATLVNTFGNGALMATSALYFTLVVGLRPTQLALAVSAGAFAGLLAQVPAGHLADLRGPRRVLQTLTFGAGLALLGLLFARSVWALVAVMAVFAVFDRGAQAVRNGYVARLAEVLQPAFARIVQTQNHRRPVPAGGDEIAERHDGAMIEGFVRNVPGPDTAVGGCLFQLVGKIAVERQLHPILGRSESFERAAQLRHAPESKGARATG